MVAIRDSLNIGRVVAVRGGIQWLLGALLLSMTSAVMAGDASAAGREAGGKPVPVTVAMVKKMNVPLEIGSFGQVVPLEMVSVQARVTSLVKEVKVGDGGLVKRGDPLFVLDSGEFIAAVNKAMATLERDTALAQNAALEDKRQSALLRQKAISQDAYDSIRADFLAAEATRAMSAADLESATLRLGYCEITSPLDGVIGRVAVKAGNLVSEYGGEMAVINRLSPIRASFFIPEGRLAEVRAAFASGRALTVVAFPEDGSGGNVEGTLAFIGNQVDRDTGTITLEAEFPNLDAALWPGQFVRIALRLSVDKDVLVVPEEALHAVGNNVYMAAVAKPDGTVEMRSCEVKRRQQNLAIVAKGLSEGELAVLDGYLRLTADSRVEIRQPTETEDK